MALPVTIRSQPTQAVQAWYLEVCNSTVYKSAQYGSREVG